MMDTKLRKLLLIFFLAFTIVTMTSCREVFDEVINTLNDTEINDLDPLLVHYIDVGQADAILLQNNDEAMLIDAGDAADSDIVIDYIIDQGITKLNYVVATHPHSDHIGAMPSIVEHFEIENFMMPDVTHTTKTFERLMTQLQNKQLKIQSPIVGSTIYLGDAELTVCAPNDSEYKNLNNYSIVLRLQFGDTSFIFTGDAEALSEEEMLKNGINLSTDVLKVGHHGSSSSSKDSFLDAVNPSIAVISCGKGNDYGHPHKEVINALNERGITILRTDELGTIVLSSDGKDILIN